MASGIRNQHNRFTYVRAMGRCLNLVKDYGNDLVRAKRELEKLQRTLPKTFIRRFEILRSTKGYYMMGVHHSLEAVNSILIRFEQGYSHNDEFFVRNILEGKGERDER